MRRPLYVLYRARKNLNHIMNAKKILGSYGVGSECLLCKILLCRRSIEIKTKKRRKVSEAALTATKIHLEPVQLETISFTSFALVLPVKNYFEVLDYFECWILALKKVLKKVVEYDFGKLMKSELHVLDCAEGKAVGNAVDKNEEEKGD
eukprot:scaffold27135_cov76-Cyclotella_meneghiniana.AAC.2